MMAAMSERISCPACPAVYEVTYHKVAFRDQDTFNCRKCGAEVTDWSSSRIPQFKLVEDGGETNT